MSKLQELAKVYQRDADALRSLERQRDEEVYQARRAIESRYDPAIHSCRCNASRSHKDFKAEQNRLALENVALPHPEGTVMVESKTHCGLGFRKGLRVETGRTGLIEIFRPSSVVPANMTYSLPPVGAVCIRLLKKDGTPGKSIFKIDGWKSYDWEPKVEVPA